MSFLDGARLRKPQDGVLLAYENHAAQVTAGAGFAALAVIAFASTAVLSGWGRIALALLGIVTLALGARAALGSMIKVAPPNVELRWAFQTKKIPLSEVQSCHARCDSKGLMSKRCYPELVLRNGQEIPFNAVQWPPNQTDAAADACDDLTTAIRYGS